MTAGYEKKPRFPSDDMPYGWDGLDDATDEQDEAKREALQSVRDDFRHIFSTPQGERALTFLYNFCRQGFPTFDEVPTKMAFKEGMRRVYLEIAGYVMMTDERIHEISQSQARERRNQ